MSPSAYITTRTTSRGEKRYVVRYRMGGRAFPLVHAGSFRALKDARARRDFVAGEIAAGRDPRVTLQTVAAPERAERTFAEWAVLYQQTRIDFSENTAKNLGSHLKRLLPVFGGLRPEDITAADVQAWVSSAPLKPASLRRYLATLRQIIDLAQVKPNPARSEDLRLPAFVKEEPSPPTAAHVLAIVENSPRRWRLPIVTIEQTACRVGEMTLPWGDVDVAGCRFRLRSTSTKSRRPRWVQVPEWLMGMIADTCPLEDRTADRPVFPGFTADVAKNVMARACVAAGIPHYHPHDLRHRRTSLWHGQGIPEVELSQRIGHSRPSITLDVYSHVMPLDEVPPESFRAVLVSSR